MDLPVLSRAARRWRRWRTVETWYDPDYRLPFANLDRSGMEPRRADLALWYLLEAGAIRLRGLHRPRPISYRKLSRVHGHEYLESLPDADKLAGIYALDPTDIVVDELLRTLRLACAGTLWAARYALASRRPTLNLLGGFHHARRDGGGGFCALNDLAVAVATLRSRGFRGRVAILDLDAHPPDGTADCLAGDGAAWIGSLSGSDWGPLLPGVDETRLPDGAGDGPYLEALDALLGRMPAPQLALVLAGGDVLLGDRLGRLGLSLQGARERDVRVHRALEGVPSVWVPAGGYHPDSWKVLAGTGLVLAGRPSKRISRRYDPLHARFGAISRALPPELLRSDSDELSQADVEPLYRGGREQRFLRYYTAEGAEYALFRFGFIDQVRRLGYRGLRVAVDATGAGDRLRLFGSFEGTEHLLVEVVAERRRIGDPTFLFVNWLSLRHPRAQFSLARPILPGQEVPGLGLAREAGELLALIAGRLQLPGVAFRPAYYHVAYAARYRFRFTDPARQGRFEALVRDLAGMPLCDATCAVAEGRVLLNGERWAWEPEDMIFWIAGEAPPRPEEAAAAARAREASHFTVNPPLGRDVAQGDRK